MENRINIGELDTKVTLMQGTPQIGSQGQKKFIYSEHSHVWAKVERNVTESVADMNYEAGDSVNLTVYKVKDLTTRWRVKIGDKTYEIQDIDTISRVSPLMILTLHSIE